MLVDRLFSSHADLKDGRWQTYLRLIGCGIWERLAKKTRKEERVMKGVLVNAGVSHVEGHWTMLITMYMTKTKMES